MVVAECLQGLLGARPDGRWDPRAEHRLYALSKFITLPVENKLNPGNFPSLRFFLRRRLTHFFPPKINQKCPKMMLFPANPCRPSYYVLVTKTTVITLIVCVEVEPADSIQEEFSSIKDSKMALASV